MHDGDASTEAQLRTSRARVLAAADTERRDIERALHDGIQQDLVALAVKLQLVRRLAESDPAALDAALDEIGNEVHEALESVRALSERIYPSVLEARGLADALSGVAGALGVRIEADGLGRYPSEIERAIYFCCRQALQSIPARSLRIWEEQDTLCFELAIDARDSDLPDGDLSHVRDRIDTLGGKLTVGRASISATIPLG